MLTAADLRARMTEAEWQHSVELTAKSLGWRLYHTRYSVKSAGGFPDLTMVRDGRLVFAELKSERGTVKDDQEAWLADLRAAGVEAYLWRPSDNDEMLEVLR